MNNKEQLTRIVYGVKQLTSNKLPVETPQPSSYLDIKEVYKMLLVITWFGVVFYILYKL